MGLVGLGGWTLLAHNAPDTTTAKLAASAAAGAPNLPPEPGPESDDPELTATEQAPPTSSAPPSPSLGSNDAGARSADALAQDAAARALASADYWEAKAQAQVCLKLDPRNLECSRTLRLACGRTGDFVCERAEVDECLERNPKDYECLVERAKLNTIKRRFNAAERDLVELRKQRPGGVWTILTEATIHEAKGELPKALEGYRKGCDEGQESACLAANRLDTKLNKTPAASPSARKP